MKLPHLFRYVVVPLALLVLMFVMPVAGSATPTAAPDQPGVAALLIAADQPRLAANAERVAAQRETTRERYVRINAAALGTQAAPAAKVRLDLFDDANFVADFARTETNALRSFAWLGKLEGVELGEATLVLTNGVLAGHVSLPSGQYEIRRVNGDLYVVEQLDQSRFPEEKPPIQAPAAAAPTKAPAGGEQVQADACTQIDVLVAYTPEAATADGGTANMEARIALAIAETNQSYVNSDMTQRVRLVHTMETTAGDAQNLFDPDLAALQNLSDGIFTNVDAAREEFGADEVALILEDTSACGLGYVNATATSAFVTVHRECATGYYSLAHELGHNMGALHAWYEDAAANYHHGFVYISDPTRWRTIMAYNDQCKATSPGTYCNRLQYWSNPAITYGGVAMGVSSDGPTNCTAGSLDPNPSTCAADNHLRLNNTCSTVANFRPSNQPPVLGVNTDPVVVNEGQTASNTGTVTDPEGNAVTLTASRGTVTNNGDGTWAWSLLTDDGPAESGTVTIYADDGHLGLSQISFTLTVRNVAPTATFNTPGTVNEGHVIQVSLTAPVDPSHADALAGFTYAFNCGTGYGAWGSANAASCQTYDNGTRTVDGKIRDKDGGVTEYSATVTVLNLPPVVSVDTATQTVQYSDSLCAVTFSATDVAADTLTATPASLPGGLTLTPQGCTPSANGVWQTCTWTLDGDLAEPQGSYLATVTIADEDGGSASGSTAIVVTPEDATLWFDAANPVAVKVDAPGGVSPAFSLVLHAQELTPDAAACGGAAGDIANAQVSISLVPVGPGSAVSALCTTQGVTGTGYDAVLTVSCAFDNVAVNTYWVQAAVTGGYYTSPTVEDVLVIYDPSLGFTTGGGWFYWPGTTDKVNFGYTMKYNRKLQNIQGSLLLIRHLADGSIYRVKSNSLSGLSVGEFAAGGETVGWASFVGKATYLQPGWLEPKGNYGFVFYVEDWNEPGAGYDQAWLEVRDGRKLVVPAMSMTRPPVDNTATIQGGNIVVPHNPD